MRFDIVTIFPGMFESPFSETIIKRAQEKGIVEFYLHDVRDYAHDKHRSVDDAPYGGGAGMVMKPEPLVRALEGVPRMQNSMRILLTPQGEPFSHKLAREFSERSQVILICGRYEGIDERARQAICDKEISLGDFVLSGGEIAAMAVIDAITRLLPGVLGNEESIAEESFATGLLEYPQYTRPENFRGSRVPEILRSGDSAKIRRWRRTQALLRTKEKRPDLFEKIELSDEDRRELAGLL
jgi:tRNA (guanine37-N1)-methyltransferase